MGRIINGASASAADAPVLDAEIAALRELDIHDLRLRWRRAFRRSAPSHLPRQLLVRVLAYKLQADVYGDLDRETVRLLDRLAAEAAEAKAKGLKRPITVPPITPAKRLRPGTILVREHDGIQHRVTVLQEGFAWRGIAYASLSQLAFAITGTKWNGPRFFGLGSRKLPDNRGSASSKARP